jgi:hypothetical protein
LQIFTNRSARLFGVERDAQFNFQTFFRLTLSGMHSLTIKLFLRLTRFTVHDNTQCHREHIVCRPTIFLSLYWHPKHNLDQNFDKTVFSYVFGSIGFVMRKMKFFLLLIFTFKDFLWLKNMIWAIKKIPSVTRRCRKQTLHFNYRLGLKC